MLAHEADSSLPSSAKIKNEWSYTSNFPTSLHGVYRKDLILTCHHSTFITPWSRLHFDKLTAIQQSLISPPITQHKQQLPHSN